MLADNEEQFRDRKIHICVFRPLMFQISLGHMI